MASFLLSLSLLFLGRGGQRRGQCGEAQNRVKWLYRWETRAGRRLRLKAEWQAAEAIKIEPLSLAARVLLIQAGTRASVTHTCAHTHTHRSTPSLLMYFNWHTANMDVDMCVFIYTYKQFLICVSILPSWTHQSSHREENWRDKWAGRRVETRTQTNKLLSLPLLRPKYSGVSNVR